MKITNITQQKRNIENVNLFLDNEFWVSISKNQLLDINLFKDKEIDLEEKKAIEKLSFENKIFEKVTRYISFRPRSEYELRMYLKRRCTIADEQVLDSLINKFIEKDLVNDERFARWYIENRLRSRKLHGTNKIIAELFKKGIPTSMSKQLINELSDKSVLEQNRQKLQDTIEKERKKLKDKIEDEFQIRQKIIQKLIRKGYKYDEIEKII